MKIKSEPQDHGISDSCPTDNSNSSSEFTDDSSSQSSDSSIKENQPISLLSLIIEGHHGTADEYYLRRERNNIAVRKSRDKARKRQKESQSRLQELTIENKRLQLKADLLEKELSLLRGLFPSVGAVVPQEVEMFFAK